MGTLDVGFPALLGGVDGRKDVSGASAGGLGGRGHCGTIRGGGGRDWLAAPTAGEWGKASMTTSSGGWPNTEVTTPGSGPGNF